MPTHPAFASGVCLKQRKEGPVEVLIVTDREVCLTFQYRHFRDEGGHHVAEDGGSSKLPQSHGRKLDSDICSYLKL